MRVWGWEEGSWVLRYMLVTDLQDLTRDTGPRKMMRQDPKEDRGYGVGYWEC